MNAREIRPDKRVAPLSGGDNLFLAGSIENGKTANWQQEVVEYFGGYNLNIYNPRVAKWNGLLEQSAVNKEFAQQVTWEQKKILSCSLVLVNFVSNTISPISLLELGQLSMLEKRIVVVCCPKDYWKTGNIEVTCALHGMFLYEKLEQGLAHLRTVLEFKEA